MPVLLAGEYRPYRGTTTVFVRRMLRYIGAVPEFYGNFMGFLLVRGALSSSTKH